MNKPFIKFKVERKIMEIISKKGFIVPSDLMKELGINNKSCQIHLFNFELDRGYIKSKKRRNYGKGRYSRIWKFKK